MSLWLCRQEQVHHPFYVENLNIHLHSSQELSYVICQYPLMVMDGFVDENLLEFLREELDLGFLALKLERWLASHEDPDEALVMILQECDYYTSAEIARYRQKLTELRRKHPAEYRKMKADELFAMHQYGRAAKVYQELLESPKDSYVNEVYEGRIWNNLGSCYARQFRMQEAFDAYERAYNKLGKEEVLQSLYCLTKLDDSLTMGDRMKALMTEDLQKVWDGRFAQVQEQAGQSDAVGQLEDMFQRDSIRRQAGAASMIHRWKQEYRNMV